MVPLEICDSSFHLIEIYITAFYLLPAQTCLVEAVIVFSHILANRTISSAQFL